MSCQFSYRKARILVIAEITLDPELLTQSLPVLLAAIVVAAILQDDITCLVVGIYVSGGELPFVPAVLACFAGTLLGDYAWFFSGRFLGSLCLERAPVKWVVSPARLEQAKGLFMTHGATAIVVTRFVPVIRTPVQVVAGMLSHKVWKCLFLLACAAAVYAPLLVGASVLLGNTVDVRFLYEQYGHLALLAAAFLCWVALAAVRLLARKSGDL